MSVSPSPSATDKKGPELKRTMGLFALTIYGVGDMLGAGIYVLVGTAARQMGNAVWLAFVVAAVAALFTGLSYAALGSRYPKAAGCTSKTATVSRAPPRVATTREMVRPRVNARRASGSWQTA